MDNFEKIIKRHNNKIIKANTTPEQTTKKTCNCRKRENCPLNGKCLISNVVYKATVTTDSTPNEKKYYIGLSSTSLKDRIRNHNVTFTNENYKNKTSLSTYIWELEKNKKSYKITWEVIAKAPTCYSLHTTCHLCMQEKMAIAEFEDKDSLLNRRSEIGMKCKHKAKYLLKALKAEEG